MVRVDDAGQWIVRHARRARCVAHVDDDAILRAALNDPVLELGGGQADAVQFVRKKVAEAAAALIGPLAGATPADVAAIPERLLRRRARHVVTENARVRETVAALRAGDPVAAGAALDAGFVINAITALIERLVPDAPILESISVVFGFAASWALGVGVFVVVAAAAGPSGSTESTVTPLPLRSSARSRVCARCASLARPVTAMPT